MGKVVRACTGQATEAANIKVCMLQRGCSHGATENMRNGDNQRGSVTDVSGRLGVEQTKLSSLTAKAYI